jgi:hypothetical protein
MAELKNIRHEKFCRHLADGKTVDEAYVAAGFAKNRGNAARLKAKELIGRRAAELVASQHQVETVDRAWVLAELQTLYRLTSTSKQGEPTWSPATAKATLELIGKEHSMFIDRKIIGIKRLEDMGDDELRQIAGQVIAELDAQVTEDGEVRAVEAELIEPPTKRETEH